MFDWSRIKTVSFNAVVVWPKQFSRTIRTAEDWVQFKPVYIEYVRCPTGIYDQNKFDGDNWYETPSFY
jgi:hypothetical protein